MTSWPRHPVVYEINTWVWLNALGRQFGRRVTLGDVPDEELRRLSSHHFDGLWLMGVWERSARSREIAVADPGLRSDYLRSLPDWTPDDVVGSPYAVRRYQVDPALGDEEGLAALRARLRSLDLRLVLDFVPNHIALDHPWTAEHPERLMPGEAGAPSPFAHGRDPHFSPWTDVFQLDYRRPDTRRAMTEMLLSIAERCDGIRCDMAMLVTREVFLRTWGGAFVPAGAEFWPDAIAAVKRRHPDLLLVAEVYWGLEFELQQQGFDYTYDKRLYDRLIGVDSDTSSLVEHLRADAGFQSHLVRFVENHDEPRAASVFGPRRSRSAATLALTLPGMRLLHQGQLEGARRKLPVQLSRRAPEPPEPGLEAFYQRLLEALSHRLLREGAWAFIEPNPAWPGNPSHRAFAAHRWQLDDRWAVVAVNLSGHQAQCHLPLALPGLRGRSWRLRDLLSDLECHRAGDELIWPGLFLDMPGHSQHLFELEAAAGNE